MPGETNLSTLLRTMTPVLNEGSYVFCLVDESRALPPAEMVGSFREAEGVTVIVPKEVAVRRQLPYSLVAAWITPPGSFFPNGRGLNGRRRPGPGG